MALSWLAVEETDTVAAGRRRRRALLILAGSMVVAVGVAAAALLLASETPTTHPGKVRSVVVSPDGRFKATIYSFHLAFSFDDTAEVTLSRVGSGDEVSLGCQVTAEEESAPVEVRFEAGGTALTVEAGGETQRIQFDPRTLHPSDVIGPC